MHKDTLLMFENPLLLIPTSSSFLRELDHRHVVWINCRSSTFKNALWSQLSYKSSNTRSEAEVTSGTLSVPPLSLSVGVGWLRHAWVRTLNQCSYLHFGLNTVGLQVGQAVTRPKSIASLTYSGDGCTYKYIIDVLNFSLTTLSPILSYTTRNDGSQW